MRSLTSQVSTPSASEPRSARQRDSQTLAGPRSATSRRLAVGGAVIAVACALSGCAATGNTSTASGGSNSAGQVGSGFTNGEVRLSSSYPTSLSGPDEMLGMQAYFNYVDQTSGGVKMADGKTYKIEFKYLDDGYDTGRAVSNVKNLLATYHPAAIVGLLGSAINEATIGQLDSAGVPNLYSIEGDDYWQANINSHPMMGPTSQPSDSLWVQSELSYVKKHWPGAKLAVLLQNDAYGQDIKKALDADVTGSGLSVVDTEYYNTGAPSVSTQIAKLSNSGATVFLDFSLAPAMTQGLQYMQTINWHVPHFVCYNCLSQTSIGPAGSAADKLYAPLAFVDPAIPEWSNLPQIVKLRNIITKYGATGAKASEPGLQGAAIAQLLVKNLEASQPNSQSLINTVRSQQGNQMALLINGTKVVTAPTYPYLVNQLRMAQYTYSDKTWKFVAPPYVDTTYKK